MSTPTHSDKRIDGFGLLVYGIYVFVGGLLVFGFAWSLRDAVKTQNESVCRGLTPEPREGPAPEFTVQDLAGNPVSLADLRGKFVVLNFWATWCEPCLQEWPQVHKLAERLAEHEDIVVVAVSIDQDRKAIEPYLQRMGLQDTAAMVLWDPEQSLHTTFGTSKIPDTYFIDADGQLVNVFVNVRQWGSPEAYQCVAGSAER